MEEFFVGKSIDEVKNKAAARFGVPISRIEVEILEEPKKGFFGNIKGEAKIKATFQPTKLDIGTDYLKKVLSNIGISEVQNITETEDGATISISQDENSLIIGKNGEVLDALQYLACMVCNHNDKDYFRISVDCGGYREKRVKSLEELAVKVAKGVLKNGRSSALEPMNPYERRIIHSAVSTVEGVSSRSTGEEPFRKVIIVPLVEKSDVVEKKQLRPNTNVRGTGKKDSISRGEKTPYVPSAPRTLDLKTSFEKEYKKPQPKPEDSLKGDLYGKISIDNK